MSPRDIYSWFHFYLLLGWRQCNVYTVTTQTQVWLSFYHISSQFYVLLFYVSSYFKHFYFCSFRCQVFCVWVCIDMGIVGSRGSECAVDVSLMPILCTALLHRTAEGWLLEEVQPDAFCPETQHIQSCFTSESMGSALR